MPEQNDPDTLWSYDHREGRRITLTITLNDTGPSPASVFTYELDRLHFAELRDKADSSVLYTHIALHGRITPGTIPKVEHKEIGHGTETEE